MRRLTALLSPVCFAALALVAPGASQAAVVNVTITAQNLLPGNSESFAPLRFGFNSGVFDAFNAGQAATAPIVSIAEGGSGSAWFPAFAAADPTATLGTAGGLLQPGQAASTTVTVDTVQNPYFTFAAMVVPSNDFFIGNDSPTQFRLLDAGGNLLINSIGQKASDIWDNGSETFDPKAAAFLVIGNNALRTPQNGVVNRNFAELAQFDGLTTAAGYVLTSGLTADTDIYRITFAVTAVPEPTTLALMSSALLGLYAFRRRGARR